MCYPTPRFGQSPLLCTDAHPRQFQSTAGGPAPPGSGFAHPTSGPGESVARVLDVGVEPAQAQGTPVGNPEVAQPPSALCRPSVSFAAPAGPEFVVQEPEDEEEYD